MNSFELTYRALTAKTGPMQGRKTDNAARRRRPLRRRVTAAAMLMGSALALGGCVSVTAPDKPIVIELNINIKQEVVYRLAGDAAKTIDANPGVF
jgi:cell division septal protein FtsQ